MQSIVRVKTITQRPQLINFSRDTVPLSDVEIRNVYSSEFMDFVAGLRHEAGELRVGGAGRSRDSPGPTTPRSPSF